MNAADPHGLTAPYAVDAVTDAERREAEDHLAACAECRAELAELAEVLGEVGSAAPVEPPPSLRAAVMARLDDVPQLPREAARGVSDGVPVPVPVQSAVRAAGATRRDPSPVDELAARRSARRRLQQVVAAAAAAVVLAGGGLLGVTALQERSERQAAQRAAEALAEVAAAPDAVTVPAAPASDRSWSQTRLVVSRSRQRAVLIPAGTRPAPAGRTWEVWYVDGGKSPRPAGTFDEGSAGAAVLSGDVGPASAVAVTLEPDGGSTTPTTVPVATYPVPSA